MITRKHYKEIEAKYGEFASWAVWAKEDAKPKSNIGDMSIFDLNKNSALLNMLNPNAIMVGLIFQEQLKKSILESPTSEPNCYW